MRVRVAIASTCHTTLKGQWCPGSGKGPAVCAETVAVGAAGGNGARLMAKGGVGEAACLWTEHGAVLSGSAFREAGLEQVNLCSVLGVAPCLWLQIAVLS